MLGRDGSVFAVDCSPLSAARYCAEGFDLVPRADDPDYVSELLRICDKRQISHVIPTIDTELSVLAASRSQFEARGVHVWVSSPRVVEIAQDKRLTNRWLSENGFPVVQQCDLASAQASPDLSYPLIAKPARGSSSDGLETVNRFEQLGTLDPALDYVVEEVATGEEHTIDVWVDAQGKARAAVPRRRIETRAGEVSKGVTVRDVTLMALAQDVAEALPGARAVLNVQVFADPERNEQKVIEINARFGGGFPLSWAAGARMPLWVVQDLEGNPPKGPLDDWTNNLMMLRYDQGIYVAGPHA